MKLRLIAETTDYIALYKPNGITTHQSTPSDWGFVEWASYQLQTTLFVVHRLDRDTSGIILFAKTSEAAKKLTEKWEDHQVRKSYLFFSDKKPSSTSMSHQSLITKEGKQFRSKFQSLTKSDFNSETHFELIKSDSGYYLYRATPITGKPHQIRLHAQDLGIPILGDTEHGGRPFIRLCLHAESLTLPPAKTYYANPPSFFENLADCKNEFLCKLIDSFHRRDSLYLLESEDECLRMTHTETDPIRIDKFGSQYWIYNYADTESDDDTSKSQVVQNFLKDKKWFERQMLNRGQNPQASGLNNSANIENEWIAEENKINFQFRSNSGLSPGLFLDQRENRKWVLENSLAKDVLNLFSYTGGFSLAAAKGKAKSVCTVDVSKNFIEWSKKNFEINQFDPKQFEFWFLEAQEFIKICKKKNRKFDLIICDPPSLARNKSGIFKIEKDLPPLINDLWQLLSPKGALLLSTNFERWSQDDFENQIKSSLTENYHTTAQPLPGLDYEVSAKNRLLKSLLIQKI